MRYAAIFSVLLFSGAGDDYYPLKEGYVWNSAATITQKGKPQELDTSIKVSGRKKIGDKECFILDIQVAGALSKEYLTVDEQGVKLIGGARGGVEFTYDQSITRLKYPLQAGTTWQDKVAQGEVTVTYTSTVVGEEEVEVPAGKYKALKVKGVMETPGGKTETTNWYAKEVGIVKQWVKAGTGENAYELTIGLKSFEKEGK